MRLESQPISLGAARRSLRDLVCDELRRLIMVGELPSGSRLVEDRLADQLGVSRNPVREALHVLHAEGFVELLPRRGALVARLSSEEVEQLFDVRMALEALAARTAARNATEIGVQRLRDLVKRAQEATEAGELDRVTDLNTEFHSIIADIGGNGYLRMVSEPVLRRSHWVFRQSAAARAKHSWTEHQALLDAIVAGDAEAAEAQAVRHVSAALHSFRRVQADAADLG